MAQPATPTPVPANPTLVPPTANPAPATARLSEWLLGLDWSALAPCTLGDGAIVLRTADHGEVERFTAEHRDVLVAPESATSRFARLDEGRHKARFCAHALDCFAIEADGRVVGVFVGQVWDWSSYYLRYLGMLPGARGHGAVAGIIRRFGAFLREHGVQRLEMDVSVSHLAQLRRAIGEGFYPMGTLQSDRWGSLVHLVQFLSEPHESVFLDQFSAGIRSRSRAPRRLPASRDATNGRS